MASLISRLLRASLGHHENGEVGAALRNLWGPGIPFRLQLLFLVQETHLSARLGHCSKGQGPSGQV